MTSVIGALISISFNFGAARQVSAQESKSSIELLTQTPWVTTDQPFTMKLNTRSELAPDQLEIAVSVFRRVANRSEFNQTIQNQAIGSPLILRSIPLTELPAGGEGSVDFVLNTQDAELRNRLSTPGVYPVRVELRKAEGGSRLDRFTTHLVNVVPQEATTKLGFSWVLPVHLPPSLKPDGKREINERSITNLSSSFAVVKRHPDLPLDFRPTPETIEALEQVADGKALVDEISQVVGDRQLLSSAYTLVNLSSLAALPEELERHLQRGSQVITNLLAKSLDDRTWVVDKSLSQSGLQHMQDKGFDQYVLPEGSIAATPKFTITLTQPFLIKQAADQPDAVAFSADSGLAAHFKAPASSEKDKPVPQPAVLSAHQMLADLAVIYFDRPQQSDPRGVVLVTPPSWRPSPEFLQAAFSGLSGNPLIETKPVNQLFDTVALAKASARRNLIRALAPSVPDRLQVSTLRLTRDKLDNFQAIIQPDRDDSQGEAPNNDVADNLDARILIAESLGLPSNTRTQYFSEVRKTVDSELAKIQMPPDRSIRLTARQGRLPISIQSDLEYPVKAVLEVKSDKLSFPEGTTRTLTLSRENTTELFLVRTRTSGAFPLEVTLRSPDGKLLLADSVVTVRSSAVSNVGWVLSIGAAAVLAGWWGRYAYRNRSRARHPAKPAPVAQ